MKPLSRTLVAATALLLISQTVCHAEAPSDLCARLAAKARRLPTSAWAQGVGTALMPEIALAEDRSPDSDKGSQVSGIERRITKLPWVREAVGASDFSGASVSRLPGQDIYMVSTVQGTLHCKAMAFVRARAGTDPDAAPTPSAAGGP